MAVGGGGGITTGPAGPQYDPFSNTWTYKGRRYAQYGDALASDNPNAAPTAAGTGATLWNGSLPPSMQSLSAAGSSAAGGSAAGVDDATAYIRAQQAAEAQRAFQASQAGLDRAQQTSLASGKQSSDATQAALDRQQQTSLAQSQQAAARELAALEAGFTSAAAKDAYERTAEQAALDRAFQTSTTATGVQTSREAQDRMMAYIAPYLSSFTGTGGSSGGGAVTPPGDDDALATQAQTAAFNRAKDQTADLARSSLMTLRSAAAERGVNVAGGTNPALLSAEARTLSDANKPLTDLTRQQAIDTSTRAQSVADRNYQGNIALQGQKASLAPSLLSLLKVGGLY